eukprot:8215904-Alexandrium_andersonii.AAC.1
MGPGDMCLIVNWNVAPINRRGRTLGGAHPRCAELSAGPGPNAAALSWKVATSQALGAELHFWAGTGSQ